MGEEIVESALSCLGKGFDITSDFRLNYCKGKERLVLLNEAQKRQLQVPGFGTFKDVSVDIKCDKGDRTRYQSDILNFSQMSEFFNQKSSVTGKIPSGFFNATFGFQGGSWAIDAANTKYLGLDGYFIILFNVHIDRFPLVLSDEVRDAVPSCWDARALARFIEKYGTHVIVGLSIGGQDMVLVKQDKSSGLGPSELKQHLDELGDQLFTGACNFSPQHPKTKDKAPQAFNVFSSQPIAFNSFSSVNAKDGLTVICFKRGGDPSASSHSEWLLTVPFMPDAIHFNFIPITSLLKGAPGKGFLSHAINLYLRYKPPIADLQYFLDFQLHRIWAPIHNDLPLGSTTNRPTPSSTLRFNLMGPKLYVNQMQVTVGRRPVTGMRLYLEGMKCNKLAIHLQHLSNAPMIFENKIDETSKWQGSEDDGDDRYFEAIQSKMFSHVSTAPVKYDPRWTTSSKDAVFIVTGAQLHVKKHDSKTVLHLRLLFSKVSDSYIVQSTWVQGSSSFSQKSGIFSAINSSFLGIPAKEKQPMVVVDSGVFPTGPPVPVQTQKLLKFVDMSELCKGPLDSPGHWLVTGARLDLEKGKICLNVKFSLLNIC
ncbi:MACPF domain-containing protein At1g14780 [Juglans microcarpa x Juglans regia]|uniref:MACPF domain-containing protein At1g14780 n=1 Tax=Juglans microcarpa x Juglans regia TaxID=2249226 RepID=UPI001B7EBB98|nr:MACPF domain-containing protein At1g14780 [Juglans microcarpa x Juglans regia]